jgi:hypothetical protein
MATDPPAGETLDLKLQAAIEKAQAAVARIEGLEAEISAFAANAKVSQETATAAAASASSLSGKVAPTLAQAKALLEAATNSSAEIPPILEQVKKSSAEVAPILEQVKTSRTEVLGLLEVIKTDSAKTAEIARIADEKDKRVAEYEKQLAELAVKYKQLEEKLYSLLPAATGVGLAKSFHSRKEALRTPIKIYFVIFLLSVIGFILFGMYGIFIAKIQNIEDFFRFLVERSPIIIGLILLEEFSRRQFAATTKLEEDYAYKETISIAFDGYKKAMVEIQSSPADSLTTLFSKSVIETLHERPGRLLDAEEKPILPFAELLGREAGAGEKDDTAKVLPEMIRSVKGVLQGVWIRNSVFILLVLLIGAGVGYYIANKSMGAHIETSIK